MAGVTFSYGHVPEPHILCGASGPMGWAKSTIPVANASHVRRSCFEGTVAVPGRTSQEPNSAVFERSFSCLPLTGGGLFHWIALSLRLYIESRRCQIDPEHQNSSGCKHVYSTYITPKSLKKIRGYYSTTEVSYALVCSGYLEYWVCCAQ